MIIRDNDDTRYNIEKEVVRLQEERGVARSRREQAKVRREGHANTFGDDGEGRVEDVAPGEKRKFLN